MAATSKRFKAEQIVNLLREIDVMTANGTDDESPFRADSDSEHHQHLSPLTQTYFRSSTTSIGVIYRFSVDKFKHRRQPSPNRRSRSFLALFQ